MWRTGTFIAFRDTFAVRLLQKGVPIQTVSVLLALNGEDSRILADVGTARVASERDLDIDPGPVARRLSSR